MEVKKEIKQNIEKEWLNWWIFDKINYIFFVVNIIDYVYCRNP